ADKPIKRRMLQYAAFSFFVFGECALKEGAAPDWTTAPNLFNVGPEVHAAGELVASVTSRN
ncbi:MAG: hypothetical protein AAGD43_32735, partial [Pseudomonadota bacterium]